MKSRRGFTFFELIITIGLMLLVVVILATTLTQNSRGIANVRSNAALESDLINACSQLRGQLLAMNLSPAREFPLTTVSNTSGRGIELNFVTASLTHGEGIGDVSYRIENGRDGPYLAYREHPFVYPDNIPSNLGTFTPLSFYITDMQCEFSGPQGFQTTWKDTKMPQRIRFRFTWKDGTATGTYAMTVEPALTSLGLVDGSEVLDPTASPSASPSPSPSPGVAP